MKVFKQAFQQNHLILSLGLGLFLLLAGSTSLTSAWMMTLALLLNLFLVTTILYFLRTWLTPDNRWLVIMIVMGTVATMVQMLSLAFLPTWVEGISNVLPLMAVSGIILARVDTVVMSESYRNIILDTLGSVLGFAMVILPIGFFADFLGLGVFQFASPVNDVMLWSITLLPESLRLPIFTGGYASIGILLLASLWIALLRRFGGTRV
jgi:Na+-translocating ferredoxin:NAD+ oxidoreductase RnfE subunit